jgi:hypothetical protein
MNWLGRYQKGEIVPLTFATVDASEAQATPDAVPTAMIYRSGAIVAGLSVPALDDHNLPGLFQASLFLEPQFSAGHYQVVFNWMISSTNYTGQAFFEVLSSGDPEGGGIALATFRMPGMHYALMQTRSGRITKMRNPRAL